MHSCTSGDVEMERLEMAHIKLEAVLRTSGRWQITDAPLLRWRKKLKHAARECEDTLQRYKRRAEEDEEKEREARSSSSSLPRRLAHATRSLVSSFLRRRGKSRGSTASVRRFERFADGAGEFLRLVELGGTPRQYMFFDPLIGRLLAGEELRYRVVRGSQYRLFCVRPVSFDDRGPEAKLLFVSEDDEAPDKSLYLGLMLRLSESTDVVGISVRFLRLVTSHFKPAAEAVTRELAELPTQDFSWVPYVDSTDKEHWNSIHSTLTQWFRPDPHCCKHQHPNPCSSSATTWKPSDSSLEPLIEVSLQCYVPLQFEMETPVPRYLRLGLLFSPHVCCSEDQIPSARSSAIEVIDGEEQSGVHTDISLEQLDEALLPRAIACLNNRAEAAVHQMVWKSEHGGAYLQAEKMSPPGKIRRAGKRNGRRSAIRRRRDPKLERWIQMVVHFLNLWGAHAPDRLQGSIVEWLRKANETELAQQSDRALFE